MKMTYLLLASVIFGCAAVSTPQQAVYQAKVEYAAALNLAVAYKRLPDCTKTAVQPCSSATVVSQLQKADDVAAAALDAAESAVRTPGFGADVGKSAITAANSALAALLSITQTLGVK